MNKSKELLLMIKRRKLEYFNHYEFYMVKLYQITRAINGADRKLYVVPKTMRFRWAFWNHDKILQIYEYVQSQLVVKCGGLLYLISKKTQEYYQGPYVILKILPTDTYAIKSLKHATCIKLKSSTTFHISQLKAYKSNSRMV